MSGKAIGKYVVAVVLLHYFVLRALSRREDDDYFTGSGDIAGNKSIRRVKR